MFNFPNLTTFLLEMESLAGPRPADRSRYFGCFRKMITASPVTKEGRANCSFLIIIPAYQYVKYYLPGILSPVQCVAAIHFNLDFMPEKSLITPIREMNDDSLLSVV